jgi:flagellar hook protein FlgE
MLDVTGNNIANVNTTGFKSSQTQFKDTLSQILQNSGAPQGNVGGTNPAQVGLGVQVAGITTNFSQGAAQVTNRSTDVMISGDGFFVVQKGNQQFYTRAGAFDFDANGNLVTPEGAFVMGWAAQNGVVDPNGILSPLQLPMSTLNGSAQTTSVTFDGNLPSDAAAGTTLNRDIEVYDTLGNSRIVTLTFEKVTAPGAGAMTWNVSGSDPNGNSFGPTAMSFDANGQPTGGTTHTLGGIAIDLGTTTGYANLTTLQVASRDGQQAGALQSFQIGADGTIIGSFSNGMKEAIGRISLATFANPNGLEKQGGNLYGVSVNSGDPEIGVAADGGRGSLVGGALEMSNVDLSAEFTNLIIAQRGFQANSRVITTSDEVLQELVNLKR